MRAGIGPGELRFASMLFVFAVEATGAGGEPAAEPTERETAAWKPSCLAGICVSVSQNLIALYLVS